MEYVRLNRLFPYELDGFSGYLPPKSPLPMSWISGYERNEKSPARPCAGRGDF